MSINPMRRFQPKKVGRYTNCYALDGLLRYAWQGYGRLTRIVFATRSKSPGSLEGSVMVHIKRILYPTDFSSYSNQAYLHAVALAEVHKAGLTVLYVYPGASDAADTSRDEAQDRAFWRSQLEQIRPANPRIPVSHVFLEGDPGTEIARYAQDANIDLIVMGTHGRTGMERMLLGSVAEQTLRAAPCSVLVIKLPRGIPAAEKPHVGLAAPVG